MTATRYLGAKSLTAWVLTLPAIAVVFLLGALVNHVSLPAERWVATVGITWVGSLVFVAIGIALGLLAVGEASQFVALGVFFPLSMLGGLWFPLSLFPDTITSIANFLPTRALYQLAEFASGVSGASPERPLLVLGAWTAVCGAIALNRSSPPVLVRLR